MELIVKSRSMDLNGAVKERIEKKIKNNVLKYFDKVTKIEVELLIEKNPKINLNNIAEVTVFTPGDIIRIKSEGTDMFEAIDMVSKKLERQIKRYRNKIIQKRSRKNSEEKVAAFEDIEEDLKKQVVKVKTFTIKPTSPEEAIMQMELIGHDFFVFINAESGKTAVIYRRKDGNYGLIEPNI